MEKIKRQELKTYLESLLKEYPATSDKNVVIAYQKLLEKYPEIIPSWVWKDIYKTGITAKELADRLLNPEPVKKPEPKKKPEKVREKKKPEPETNFFDSTKNPDDCFFQYFIKYPPREPLPIEDVENLKLAIWETDINVYTWMHYKAFRETKNPIKMMQAFIEFHKAGVYPPFEILEFLSDKFELYLNSQKNSLDKLLGLTKGKGQNNALKQLKMELNRDQALMIKIYHIRRLFNLSVEIASEMVEAMIKEMPDKEWDKLGFTRLSAQTLRDRYLKKWIKMLEKNETENSKNYFKTWTEAMKIEFLKQFPAYSIPHKLKKKYGVKSSI